MNVVVGLFVAFMLVYLLIFWRDLKKTNRRTRWSVYGIYAMSTGLWVYFFLNTSHDHLATVLQAVLNPLVPFGL